MPLQYALYPNKMSKGTNVYRALVSKQRNYSYDELVRSMAARNLRLNEEEIKGVLGVFMEEVADALENGGSVSTPLFKAKCSVSGLFTGADDSFYRDRHRVRVNLKPGSLLKTMAERVSTRKINSSLPRPFISQFTDMKSGNKNSTVTPGAPAIVKGARLKFNPDDLEQGAFFMNEEKQLIRVPTVMTNHFSQLAFMVPAGLPPGVYRFLVKSKLNTQQLRSGELDSTLLVE